MAKLHPLELLWARDSFDGFGVAPPWHASRYAFLSFAGRDKVRSRD
jgi:hypothetical protein